MQKVFNTKVTTSFQKFLKENQRQIKISMISTISKIYDFYILWIG